MRAETRDCSQLERDILEWDIPEEVLAVLLKDRTTGHNLIWATDDYAERGDGSLLPRWAPKSSPDFSIQSARRQWHTYFIQQVFIKRIIQRR